MAESAFSTKTCGTCRQTKNLAEFNHDKHQRDGYDRRCRECHRDRLRRAREADREAHNESRRKWRAANKEKNKEIVHRCQKTRGYAWKMRTKEEDAARRRLYRAEGREHIRASEMRSRAKRLKAPGKLKPDDITSILKAQRYKCGYCRVDVRSSYHVDHVIPLARGGANERRNIQILCQACNLSKGAKDPVQFAISIGMLL